jgi:hypothetical protein
MKKNVIKYPEAGYLRIISSTVIIMSYFLQRGHGVSSRHGTIVCQVA